jgi:cytochrome c oxidase subunit 2
VDPAALSTHPEFANPTVATTADGRIVAPVVTSMFSFAPDPIVVPANRPVTFRITSSDVVHGFQVVGTNANAMAFPGYVSQFTMTFPRPGEYLITCNEYCGVFHHAMVGKLVVQ